MSARLSSGDTSTLAEMHAITSGLKVLVTTTGAQDIEVARRCLGGHGYSAFAGLGRLYADYVASTTYVIHPHRVSSRPLTGSASYEGDNFVLDQQVVRAALKSFTTLFSRPNPSSSGLSPSTYYLRLLVDPAARPPTLSTTVWSDVAVLVQLLEWRAACVVQDLAQNPDAGDASVNQRVSKAVTEAFIATQVAEMIASLTLPSAEREIVTDVYKLVSLHWLECGRSPSIDFLSQYLLTTIEAALVDLFSFRLFGVHSEPGFMDPTRSLRLSILNLCRKILPNAIGLSDAFGFTDWELDR